MNSHGGNRNFEKAARWARSRKAVGLPFRSGTTARAVPPFGPNKTLKGEESSFEEVGMQLNTVLLEH